MKLTEFGPRVGGCPKFYYVDPPLHYYMHTITLPAVSQADVK